MIWTHYDPLLAANADAGLAQLSRADVSGPASVAVRNLQAVIALKAILVGHLCGVVTYSLNPSTGETTASVEADVVNSVGERGDIARGLLAPLFAYALEARLPPDPGTDVSTIAPSDTGLWPVVVIVIVAGGAVLLGGWIAQKAADVVTAWHAVNAQRDELQKADARLTQLVSEHVQKEQAAGKTLPIDDATKAQLQVLTARTQTLTDAIKSANPDAGGGSSLPWYAWAGIGVGGALVLALMLRQSGGGVTIVREPLAQAA